MSLVLTADYQLQIGDVCFKHFRKAVAQQLHLHTTVACTPTDPAPLTPVFLTPACAQSLAACWSTCSNTGLMWRSSARQEVQVVRLATWLAIYAGPLTQPTPQHTTTRWTAAGSTSSVQHRT